MRGLIQGPHVGVVDDLPVLVPSWELSGLQQFLASARIWPLAPCCKYQMLKNLWESRLCLHEVSSRRDSVHTICSGPVPLSPAGDWGPLLSLSLSFRKYYLFIWLRWGFLVTLRVSDLCCGMWILVPWPEIELEPLPWEREVLATRPPGKSHFSFTSSPHRLKHASLKHLTCSPWLPAPQVSVPFRLLSLPSQGLVFCAPLCHRWCSRLPLIATTAWPPLGQREAH